MGTRLSNTTVTGGAMKAMYGLEAYLKTASIEAPLLHLVKLRVSQLNGCAYCIDMHYKDLRSVGENEQRLYMLDAWREAPFYTARERAALEWAEALTFVAENHVPDELFERIRTELSEAEIVDLTLAVTTINAWNRLSIAFRTEPGTYQPAARHA
jgi:AhpD family alkylhydroperoxidase